MRKTSPKEQQSVLALNAPERFRHFIKRVADDEVVWGLWSDGWAMMAFSDNRFVFPLWPAREYAQQCAGGEWGEHVPKEIPLGTLIEKMLPRFKVKDISPAIFPTPTGQGVVLSTDELAAAIKDELTKYE
jgi:hypothetical protein